MTSTRKRKSLHQESALHFALPGNQRRPTPICRRARLPVLTCFPRHTHPFPQPGNPPRHKRHASARHQHRATPSLWRAT